MSTNDDSASRRGRRPEQGGQQRRPQGQDHDDGRWHQAPRDQGAGSHRDPRGRNEPPPAQGNRPYDPRQNAYSAFSRHSYEPPRQEAAPPPPPPPPAPRRAPDPAPQSYQQNYYPEPAPRNDPPPRPYVEQTYTPPPLPSYEPEPHAPSYPETGRDDLFGRESGPVAYEQNHYGVQHTPHRSDGYDQHSERDSVLHSNGRGDDTGYLHRETSSPLDDYERGFAARMAAQESQSSRFFLPDEPAPQPRQAQPERGYAPPQNYDAGGYRQHEQPAGHYGADSYDGHQDQHGGWDDDMHAPHGEEVRSGLPQTMSHGGELDEDFFADEDEFDHDEQLAKPKKGRKKLIAVALIGAIGVGAGGAYVYKTMKGGHDGSPTLIRAEKPSRELPGNPGGKQYANGDKTIYDRLGPDGTQTQAAVMTATTPAPSPTASRPQVSANAGSSLEERIDEALRKAQKSGDTPPSSAAPSGGRPGGDMPTVVRGETYRPDGTRVDAPRPAITPNFGNAGQLPGSFAPSPAPASNPPAPAFRASPAPAAPPQHFASRSITPASAPAAPAASSSDASAPGYYVSLKSAPDEKAIQRDLTVLADKYKSALGDVQLATKVADLGDKGVTYRAVAGPLNTRQEAMDLCNKLKAAGGSCFVTK